MFIKKESILIRNVQSTGSVNLGVKESSFITGTLPMQDHPGNSLNKPYYSIASIHFIMDQSIHISSQKE